METPPMRPVAGLSFTGEEMLLSEPFRELDELWDEEPWDWLLSGALSDDEADPELSASLFEVLSGRLSAPLSGSLSGALSSAVPVVTSMKRVWSS